MRQTLLLRLPEVANADTEWLLVDEAGARQGPRQRGPLALAAPLAKDRTVIALAPATHVLMAEPELPPGSGAKLARAVPFALEEQLSEDIAQLHFAIGHRTARNTTPVAVVGKHLMSQWLGDLAAAGIRASALYAEHSLMPANPGHTIIWLEGDRLAARAPGSTPIVVEVAPIAEALDAAGVLAASQTGADSLESALAPAQPDALLYATEEDWTRVSGEFDALLGRFASLKVQLLPDGPLPWLARELPAIDAINLLQGPYTPESSAGAHWQRWRVAAFLALGLVVAHAAASGVLIWKAKRESKVIDAQIARVFQQTLPGERLVDARRQMQDRLLHSHGGGAGFLRSLQSLGGAIQSVPQTSIDALAYREQTLDVKVSAPSVDALGQLSRKMSIDGLKADIESSTPQGDKVDGRLSVHRSGDRT
jgi:general secretion pathway protein L